MTPVPRLARSAVLAAVAALCFLPLGTTAARAPATPAPSILNLGGTWRFAVDPTREGEADRWFAPDYDDAAFDKVEVPHCWPLDPRYAYTGTAWYRRAFDTPPAFREAGLPGGAAPHARIEFDAVFARARVWLNGHLLGSHEGGYTPFGFDVSAHLVAGKPNVLVVEADNSWSTKTLPGARPGLDARRRLYPWWDYGGIVRPVSLVISSPVSIANQRLIATPDLAAGTATIESTVWVRNATASPATPTVSVAVGPLDREAAGEQQARVSVPAGGTASVTIRMTLPREAVHLWTLDHPALYRAQTRLSGGAAADTRATTFGIRRFEVRGTQLLLNGQAIRLGGANRPSDHPRFGLLEPREIVEHDLRMMKAGGMELQRLIHYALPTTLLDAADRLGLLLITEAGNWNLQPPQLEDEEIRATYKSQLREMVERDWSHPSVVAYSVGNEYASDTPAGVRWTRDMVAYVKSLDPSRPVTFASYRADRPELQRPEDEGSQHVDFVGSNLYGMPAHLGERLDRLHARWPDKPVVITEFGQRADKVADERQRVAYFREAIDVFRSRPFVAGASVWTFNDYRSRFPDTAANGYRPWGLVDPERTPRQAYEAVSKAFAAARVAAARISRTRDGVLAHVDIEARPDFPSRPLSGLTLRVRPLDTVRGAALDASGMATTAPAVAVPDLTPGRRVALAVHLPDAGADSSFRVELVRADGSVMDDADIMAAQTSAPIFVSAPAEGARSR